MSVDIRGTTGITAPGFSGDGAGLSGTGQVLQVVSYSFKGTAEYTGLWTFHSTNIAVTITPKKANSSFLITAHVCGSVNGSTTWMCRLYRNGVATEARGDTAGARERIFIKCCTPNTSWNSIGSGMYLDEGVNSTAPQEYRLGIRGHDTRSVRLNYNWSDADNSLGDVSRGISTITVQEISND